MVANSLRAQASLKVGKRSFSYFSLPALERSGLGRMHELFSERLDALIDELNKELTA